MIRQAQLRSVITDIEGYKTALNMFQDQYMALPGDMSNATSYWGATVANGNGDGHLGIPGAASAPGEIFGAWEHLANAGLIQGSYSGLAGPVYVNHSVIGTNVPASRLSGGGFTLYDEGNLSGNGNFYNGYYGHIIYFGKQDTTQVTWGAILTPSEANSIDKKSDDGIPGTGQIRTMFGGTYASNCSTGGSAYTSPSSSAYNLNYSSVACQLLFIMGF